MSLLEQSRADELIGHHYSQIHDFIKGAFAEYRSEYPEAQRLKHHSRTRANIISDLIIDGAARYFAHVDGVFFHEISGMRIFVLPGDIALRFKKLDEEFLPRNQMTNQVINFRNQLPLPGIPTISNLEAGYVLAADCQDVKMVSLVCPSGLKSNYWARELQQDAVISRVSGLFESTEQSDEVAGLKPKTGLKIDENKTHDRKTPK